MWVYYYTDIWQPWNNTVAYRPLDSINTVNDLSGNWYNLTNSWWAFWTYQWVDCVKLTKTSHNYLYTTSLNASMIWNTFTVSCWFNCTFQSGNSWDQSIISTARISSYRNRLLWVKDNRSAVYFRELSWSSTYFNVSYTPATNTWYHIAVTYDWNTTSVYINWTLINSQASTGMNITSDGTIDIGRTQRKNNNLDDYYWWWISKMIIENKIRTAQEINNYFEQNKNDYWITLLTKAQLLALWWDTTDNYWNHHPSDTTVVLNELNSAPQNYYITFSNNWDITATWYESTNMTNRLWWWIWHPTSYKHTIRRNGSSWISDSVNT